MTTDSMDAISRKRRWQPCEGGKKRMADETSPRKRRRVKTVESPDSSPLKSPFVSDSDDAPIFRTKSFYRSKGTSKFAAITCSTKENQQSPRRILTPRRASNRIRALVQSETESDSSVNSNCTSSIVTDLPSGRLKSATSNDSDSETNFIKVLRTRTNQIVHNSDEFDFPSVKPVVDGKKKSSSINETNVENRVVPINRKKHTTYTPPVKKNNGKKVSSKKCPLSAPKTFGQVIVHQGFDLKFVPRRISDEFLDKKKKTPNSDKLEFMRQRLEARLKQKSCNPPTTTSTLAKIKNTTETELTKISKNVLNGSEMDQGSVNELHLHLPVSQDSAIGDVSSTNMSLLNVNNSVNGIRSLSGSQELYSDAISEAESFSSGPSYRTLRSGIVASPLKTSGFGNVGSPSRKTFNVDNISSPKIQRKASLNASDSPSRRSLRLENLESPSRRSQIIETVSTASSKKMYPRNGDSPSRKSLRLEKMASPSSRKFETTSSVNVSGKPLFSIFGVGTPIQRTSLNTIVQKSPSVKSVSPKTTPGLSPSIKKFIKDINKDTKVEQLILDAGQKKFGATVCDVCGMVYTHADPVDETTHAKFHTNLVNTLKFPGWKKERIVEEYPQDGSRVIMVLNADPKYAIKKVADINKIMGQELGFPEQSMSFHSGYKAFLYISEEKTIEGCCIAESIQEGYRVIPDQPSTVSIPDNGQQQRPWYCETVPEKAGIGVSRIWVYKCSRNKGIASRLLDSIRSCFHYGCIVDRKELAFSDPTPDGKTFATKYTGSSAFLVYKYTR